MITQINDLIVKICDDIANLASESAIEIASGKLFSCSSGTELWHLPTATDEEIRKLVVRSSLAWCMKKDNLDIDKNDLNNHKPVSNLPYISKLIEQVVAKSFKQHLNNNHLR